MAQKDPELMAAFNELRTITNDTRSKQMQLKADIEGNQRLAKRDELINKELYTLDDSKKLYLSVGRMFMMSPKADIMKSLDARQASYKKTINNMKVESEFLERQYKQKEEELRELMKRKQTK